MFLSLCNGLIVSASLMLGRRTNVKWKTLVDSSAFLSRGHGTIATASAGSSLSTARRKARRLLPAVWMRAGTSKGLFLHRTHLPSHERDWAPIILSAMGSHDSDVLQLDGIGGATPTTSKVAVVEPSRRPGVHLDYTFAQVAIGSSEVDFTGNCGNIASGVGPFAVDEGLVKLLPGQTRVEVRIFNTNTARTIVAELSLDKHGKFVEDGHYMIPGVKTPGSEILMSFEAPAGAMTGRLFPSGNPTDILEVVDPYTGFLQQVRVSAIDAANPFILVDETSLPAGIRASASSSTAYLDFIENVRAAGSVLMGLSKTDEEARSTRGTPKIAVVSEPLRTDLKGSSEMPDVRVQAFSMGTPHKSLQMTGAVPIATAACTEGTVVHEIVRRSAGSRDTSRLLNNDLSKGSGHVVIEHPKGLTPVVVLRDDNANVAKVVLSRTARRLFQGHVVYYA